MADSRDYQFIITAGAKQDLLACKEEDPFAAATISTLLREILSHGRDASQMVEDDYSDEEIHSVGPLWSLQDMRINAYRVRMALIDRWRLIFAVDRLDQRIALVAVMHRDDDYQNNRALWRDIEREYDELGFRRY